MTCGVYGDISLYYTLLFIQKIQTIYISLFMNKIGSSETIRETTLSFIDVPQKLVSHKTFIKTSFIEWFIGFSEGDGNFIVSKKQVFFIINQKEERVLYYIRANLGFGKVSKYLSYFRYIVADKKCVDRLISIFNGNLVLHKTNNLFLLWLQVRNQYSTDCICYRGINKLPTLHNNGWLSGFTDAEGCFNAQKIKDTRYTPFFRIRLRFILDQKDEYSIFEKILIFLKTTNRKQYPYIKGIKKSGMYLFTSTHMKSHDILLEYFKKYPLRTQKKVSLARFTTLCYYIKNRKTLPWQGKVLLRIENLYKTLNSDNS